MLGVLGYLMLNNKVGKQPYLLTESLGFPKDLFAPTVALDMPPDRASAHQEDQDSVYHQGAGTKTVKLLQDCKVNTL